MQSDTFWKWFDRTAARLDFAGTVVSAVVSGMSGLAAYFKGWDDLAILLAMLGVFAAVAIIYMGFCAYLDRIRVTGTTDSAADSSLAADTPIWRAVAHIRAAINDNQNDKCFPTTLKTIRQAALDGKIKIRGRREIDTGNEMQTRFSDVRSDIPPDYWKVSTIGALATDGGHCDDTHTNPETAYAWGPKGIYEKNRYADLAVNMQEIKRLWPEV